VFDYACWLVGVSTAKTVANKGKVVPRLWTVSAVHMMLFAVDSAAMRRSVRALALRARMLALLADDRAGHSGPRPSGGDPPCPVEAFDVVELPAPTEGDDGSTAQDGNDGSEKNEHEHGKTPGQIDDAYLSTTQH
jgi:hypothetical protein